MNGFSGTTVSSRQPHWYRRRVGVVAVAVLMVVSLSIGFSIGVQFAASKGSQRRAVNRVIFTTEVHDASGVAPPSLSPTVLPRGDLASPPHHDTLPSKTGGSPATYAAFLESIVFPPAHLIHSAGSPHNTSESDIIAFLQRRAHHGFLVLIPVNDGYLDFGLNLMCSLFNVSREGRGDHYDAPVSTTSAGHVGFAFVAMDRPAQEQLEAMGLPVYRDPDVPFITSKSAAWADPKFHSLVCTKLIPVLRALRAGLRVILSDADIAFVQNPAPFFRDDVDVVFSIGSCHKDLKDNFRFTPEGIEKLNTGFYLVRPTRGVLRLFANALEVCRTSSLTGDQPAINSVIQGDWRAGLLSPRTAQQAAESDVYTYGFFDGCLFANGCVFFKHLCANTTAYPTHEVVSFARRNPPPLHLPPRNATAVMVHANFLVGKKEKVKHLTKYRLWDTSCIQHWRERGQRR